MIEVKNNSSQELEEEGEQRCIEELSDSPENKKK